MSEGPLLIAHRGHSAGHPENSMEAIISALKFDEVNGVEVDICKTKDGIYFALHDSCLSRTMERDLMDAELIKSVEGIRVELLDWNIVKEVPISFTNARVPLVNEIFEACRSYNKHIVWELKTDNAMENKRVDYVTGFADLMESGDYMKQSADWNPYEQMTIISFDKEALKIIRKRFPKIVIYFLLCISDTKPRALRSKDEKELDKLIQECKEYKFDGIQTNYDAHTLLPNLQDKIKKTGLKTGIYVGKWQDDKDLTPVGDRSPEEHRFLCERNFDLFTSNIPDEIVKNNDFWLNRTPSPVRRG